MVSSIFSIICLIKPFHFESLTIVFIFLSLPAFLKSLATLFVNIFGLISITYTVFTFISVFIYNIFGVFWADNFEMCGNSFLQYVVPII